MNVLLLLLIALSALTAALMAAGSDAAIGALILSAVVGMALRDAGRSR